MEFVCVCALSSLELVLPKLKRGLWRGHIGIGNNLARVFGGCIVIHNHCDRHVMDVINHQRSFEHDLFSCSLRSDLLL